MISGADFLALSWGTVCDTVSFSLILGAAFTCRHCDYSDILIPRTDSLIVVTDSVTVWLRSCTQWQTVWLQWQTQWLHWQTWQCDHFRSKFVWSLSRAWLSLCDIDTDHWHFHLWTLWSQWHTDSKDRFLDCCDRQPDYVAVPSDRQCDYSDRLSDCSVVWLPACCMCEQQLDRPADWQMPLHSTCRLTV